MFELDVSRHSVIAQSWSSVRILSQLTEDLLSSRSMMLRRCSSLNLSTVHITLARVCEEKEWIIIKSLRASLLIIDGSSILFVFHTSLLSEWYCQIERGQFAPQISSRFKVKGWLKFKVSRSNYKWSDDTWIWFWALRGLVKGNLMASSSSVEWFNTSEKSWIKRNTTGVNHEPKLDLIQELQNPDSIPERQRMGWASTSCKKLAQVEKKEDSKMTGPWG